MKDLDANSLCSHGGEMLAYLYDEMAAVDRDTFEVHLADCGTCIDDFAELSQSRFPVYEWKRTEFDPLPTPRVVIPFGETASVSWFDQIRTAFSFRPTFAFGGLGAVMILAVLTGYFIFGVPSGDTEIARDVEPKASPTRVATIASPSPASEETTAGVEKAKSIDEPKPVRASTAAKPTVRAPKPKPVQAVKRNDPVPVLSSIDDDEDDSLRLADIFEEIGTGE